MDVNIELREHIFEMIKNQMNANEPSETNRTYKRLSKLGYNDFTIKQLIGQCLSVELFDVFKNSNQYSIS